MCTSKQGLFPRQSIVELLLLGMCLVALLACVAEAGPVAPTDGDDVDHYAILELDKGEDSTDRDIKKQFRVLSKQYHPDHNPSEEARNRYAKIQRAHEVLSDRKKRKMYDMHGEAGVKQLEKPDQGGHMDPFAALFGGGHGGNVNRGQTFQMNLQVPLEDVYSGNTHPITIQKQKLCRKCKGTGAASKKDMATCKKCKGEGVVIQRVQMGPFVQQVQQQCPSCGGKGKTVTKKCPVCKGARVFRGDQVLDVEIERGLPEEHKITFEMEGDQNPGQIPGDVIFSVKTAPHHLFTRKGNDLHYTLKISLLEALVGFSKVISHLDGHSVVVSRDAVTPYGTVIPLAGEGMPIHNVPSEKGTLHVRVEVTFPRRIPSQHTDELRAVLKEVGGDW
eukprot:PhM_4_TR5617/c0_g1_i1/m.27640